jgi:hypothetical protein
MYDILDTIKDQSVVAIKAMKELIARMREI